MDTRDIPYDTIQHVGRLAITVGQLTSGIGTLRIWESSYQDTSVSAILRATRVEMECRREQKEKELIRECDSITLLSPITPPF